VTFKQPLDLEGPTSFLTGLRQAPRGWLEYYSGGVASGGWGKMLPDVLVDRSTYKGYSVCGMIFEPLSGGTSSG
jgi:hypothetical protein